jgi:LysM repeat protein
MPEHARRSPARLLAPLALLIVVAATVFVIAGSESDSDGGDATTTTGRNAGTGTTRTTTTTQDTTTRRRPRGNTYTVKAGDTLGGIAETTGVAVEQLLELNPDLDPQALVAGQKIKLRE